MNSRDLWYCVKYTATIVASVGAIFLVKSETDRLRNTAMGCLIGLYMGGVLSFGRFFRSATTRNWAFIASGMAVSDLIFFISIVNPGPFFSNFCGVAAGVISIAVFSALKRQGSKGIPPAQDK